MTAFCTCWSCRQSITLLGKVLWKWKLSGKCTLIQTKIHVCKWPVSFCKWFCFCHTSCGPLGIILWCWWRVSVVWQKLTSLPCMWWTPRVVKRNENDSLHPMPSLVTIGARTSRPAYSPVMTTVLRRCHLVLVMDSRLSQQVVSHVW